MPNTLTGDGVTPGDPKLTDKGIIQNNSQAKEGETVLTAETTQPAVTKAVSTTQDAASTSSNELATKAKDEATKNSFMERAKITLSKKHPDWPDDKVQSVALASFQSAMADKASGKGNEGNEEFIQPSSKEDGGTGKSA